MGRYAHHRAGAVFKQHIIRYPDWYLFSIERIDGISAGEHAFFFHVGCCAVNFAEVADPFDKCADRCRFRFAFDQFFHQRMLWCQYDIRHAERSILPGCVDRNLFAQFRHVKAELGPFAATDPVFLHGPYPLRPAAQQIEVFQQPVGIVGDFQKPLFEFFLDHYRVAAPAVAVDDLFVGQHGITFLAPVDRRLLLIGEAALKEQQEQPLGPAVVFRMAGRHLAVPVVGKAQFLLLPPHVGDIAPGPFGWVNLVLDRRILRRHAERIPAHRMQHVVAAHFLEPRHDVADRIVADMSHVQSA